jgi:hypothetical protein
VDDELFPAALERYGPGIGTMLREQEEDLGLAAAQSEFADASEVLESIRWQQPVGPVAYHGRPG